MTVGSISAGGIYYKVLGSTQLITTANNTVGGAKLVRLINTGASYQMITHVNAVSTATQGTIWLLPGGELVLQKKPADWIFSDTGTLVSGMPVSFSN
ncbi:MAG TPA: hypothetical protein VEP90_20880 [Methylomirabilota bacterium]|nr:hypothetical protein [Methylomirabilota bacterium]